MLRPIVTGAFFLLQVQAPSPNWWAWNSHGIHGTHNWVTSTAAPAGWMIIHHVILLDYVNCMDHVSNIRWISRMKGTLETWNIYIYICMGCMGKHHSVAQVLQKPLDWDQPMATHIHALYWMRNGICYRSIQGLVNQMWDSHSTKAAAF